MKWTGHGRGRASLACAFALYALLFLGSPASAGEQYVTRGYVFQSGRGLMMETEAGDMFPLKGMDLASYVDCVVTATGEIRPGDGGEDTFFVTSAQPDDGAEDAAPDKPQKAQ